MNKNWIWIAALTVGCASSPEVPEEVVQEEVVEVATEQDMTATHLAEAINADLRGDWRARNDARNPSETLAFFGLKSDMRVIEIWPGGGWYTSVLAPTLKAGGGTLMLAHNATATPTADDTQKDRQVGGMGLRGMPEGRKGEGLGQVGGLGKKSEEEPKPYRVKIRDGLEEHLKAHAEVYGEVVEEGYLIPGERVELGEPASADMVVTFRNLHGMANAGQDSELMMASFEALKPGGILGVVQHRAPEEGDPKVWAKKGYLPESYVIELAQAAGFVLEEKSEINANAKDTKDHPEGVWTLPPALRLGDQDREKYLAIGESDRMTLRFKKPN